MASAKEISPTVLSTMILELTGVSVIKVDPVAELTPACPDIARKGRLH